MEISPLVKNIFNNKQLNMNQKMTALYMLTPSQSLPPLASLPDFSELESQIMNLINKQKLVIYGMDTDFKLKYTLNE